MSSFTTELKVRLLDFDSFCRDRAKGEESIAEKLYDGQHWQLLEEFEYHVGDKESVEVISVPSGYITDFASVPRGLWNLFPPTGDYGKAAVIHDYLYSINGMTGNKVYTRKDCDDIFGEAMKVLKVGWLARSLVYLGVRIGGWVAWNNYRNRKER